MNATSGTNTPRNRLINSKTALKGQDTSAMVVGRRTMVNGRRTMVNGHQGQYHRSTIINSKTALKGQDTSAMVVGRRTMVVGRRTMVNGLRPMINTHRGPRPSPHQKKIPTMQPLRNPLVLVCNREI
jgi:hypothetical protein